jgi:outer membrane protein assembly factor BamB
MSAQALRSPDQRPQLLSALEEAENVVSRLWSFETSKKVRALAVDRAKEGDPSILVGSEDGYAYLLGADGECIWDFRGKGWVLGAGFMRLEGHGSLAVVGGEGIDMVGADGSTVDSCRCDSPVTSLCVGELNGTVAVISGHQDGTLQAYSPDLGVFWRASCPKQVVSLQCCDVDFDGEAEVIAASEDKGVYVFGGEGEVRDRFQSTHWIISLAVGDVYGDGAPRAVIAGFDGDVHVYGGGKAATLRVRRRGILGLEIGRLLPGSLSEQFVVGSSDQRVGIFDPAGRELWRFRTGYGHRVLRIVSSEPTPSLVVGGEDGAVHCFGLDLLPGLRQRIVDLARSLPPEALAPETMPARSAASLYDLIDAQRVRRRCSTVRVHTELEGGSRELAAQELVGVWHAGVEEVWKFATEGRVYDVTARSSANGAGDLLLLGSGDGRAYALDLADGSEAWSFRAEGPVRGVTWIDDGGALVGSEDGCVYRLGPDGRPLWHFGTQDWVLKVQAPARQLPGVCGWFGSEGSCVEGFDERGAPIWRLAAGARVRALACGDVDGDGQLELVVGSDDRHVYVVDPLSGRCKTAFQVPHWVLVAKAADIDGDGRAELLIGTEDGSVYAHAGDGELLWSFPTNHWVAAVDVLDEGSPEALVAIGSADGSVYGVSAAGKLNWRWDTDSRVRTIACCGRDDSGSALIAFGSYDETVTMLRVPANTELVALARSVCPAGNGAGRADREEAEALAALLDVLAPEARAAEMGGLDLTSAEANVALAALLICQGQGRAARCEEVGAFLSQVAGERDFLAFLRIVEALGPDSQSLGRVVAAMSGFDADETSRARREQLGGLLG